MLVIFGNLDKSIFEDLLHKYKYKYKYRSDIEGESDGGEETAVVAVTVTSNMPRIVSNIAR